MARPKFEPTPEQRLTVSIMAASGFPPPQICERIINPTTGRAIDKKSLLRAFPEEVENGQITANAVVAQSLFKKATGNGAQSVTAAIFWLKCRAGWKPTEGIELTGKDGQPLPGVPQLTSEQFEALARKIADEV